MYTCTAARLQHDAMEECHASGTGKAQKDVFVSKVATLLAEEVSSYLTACPLPQLKDRFSLLLMPCLCQVQYTYERSHHHASTTCGSWLHVYLRHFFINVPKVNFNAHQSWMKMLITACSRPCWFTQ
jgi:hypothetical protein